MAKEKVKDDALAVQPQGGALMTQDFAADAGAGFEETDSSCFAIPRLKILQSMSKAKLKASAEYVKGAEEGMFHNTVDNSLFDGKAGFYAVMCHYRKKFIEFEGTLDEGGGYVREYDLASGTALLAECVRDAKGNDRIPGDNHILVDVREHYLLMLDPTIGEPHPVILSMGSSAIAVSKKWMTMAGALKRVKGQPAPDAMFTHLWKITAVPAEKNGFNYFAPKVEYVCGLENAGTVTTEADFLYRSAKAFAEMVKSGQAKAAAVEGEEAPF
jgi:hypothetical protein